MARNTRNYNALSYIQNTVSAAKYPTYRGPMRIFIFHFFYHPVYSMEYFDTGALVERKL